MGRWLLIGFLALVGCEGETGSSGDRDSGPTPGVDSGPPMPGVDSGPPAPGEDSGPAPEVDAGVRGDAALVGYWVWKQTIQDGAVSMDITEGDMEWMVGPGGWPGCPDGISCTRYGIHLIAFADTGRAHYVHRVTTGSDTQHPGTYATDGDLLTFHRTEQFSCAHPPGGSTADAADFYARWRREGDDLWISVAGFGGLPLGGEMPAAEPDDWIVYRPITQAEFHGRYDHPFCGAMRKGVDSCHPLCASGDVLADAAR